MKPSDQSRFDSLYQEHLNVLRLQGLAPATIDAYSRALRRVSAFFDCCPDQLDQRQLRDYFSSLSQSHSWSSVKLDRNGLQFFYRHTLNKPWQWIDIVKPPKVKPCRISCRSMKSQGSLIKRAKRDTKPTFCASTAWGCG